MRKLLILLLLGALVFGGWYVGSPLWAMHQLSQAAESADPAALDERVDYPALRQSLKDELRTQIKDSMGDTAPDALEDFGVVVAMGLADPAVDALVTPERTATLIRTGRLLEPGDRESREAAEPIEWEVERFGLDRFHATPSDEAGRSGPTLVFSRDGFGWRLDGIELP